MHPSPLPKYRGGSPLQNQIINGETTSAVSIFKMTDKIDEGPLCFQEAISLKGNIFDILDRIKRIAVDAIIDIIDRYPDITFWEQKGEESLYQRRTPEQSKITMNELMNKPAEYLYNKIRMLQSPYPNAFIECQDGSKLYITEAHCG